MTDEPSNWGTYELTLSELEALPTLAQGQADDLKIESDSERVWLSRCTVADGEPWDHKVTVERLIGGSWIEVEHWEAEDDTDDESEDESLPYDSFNLTLDMGNAAMSEPAHVIDALRRAAQMMENGSYAGSIMDNNGNTVGRYGFQ